MTKRASTKTNPVSLAPKRKRTAEKIDDTRVELEIRRFSRATDPRAIAWNDWWQKRIRASLMDLAEWDGNRPDAA